MDHCRRARPDDLEGLLSLVRGFREVDKHPFDERLARGGLGPLLETDDFGVVLVAEEDQTPTGYAVLTWGYSLESGGQDALLDEIYITERGRGKGSELLQAVVDVARLRGSKRIFLETEARNDAARRFYSRHGFRPEDSVWMSLELAQEDDG